MKATTAGLLLAAILCTLHCNADEPASLAAIYELGNQPQYQAADVASLEAIYQLAVPEACDCDGADCANCTCEDCQCAAKQKFTRTVTRPSIESLVRLPADDPPPRPSTRKTQWQIVTAPGLADGLPEIAATLKDWQVGENPDAHFRKHCCADNPGVIEHYKATKLPAYILTYDGQEIERREGEFPGWKYLSDRYIAVATGKSSVTKSPPAAKLQPASADYPLRGSLWTHPGSGKSGLINHLMSGQHAGKFSRSYLESLDLAELESLHSDDHEGRVKSTTTSSVAIIRREPVYQYQQQQNCPNGRCPR